MVHTGLTGLTKLAIKRIRRVVIEHIKLIMVEHKIKLIEQLLMVIRHIQFCSKQLVRRPIKLIVGRVNE